MILAVKLSNYSFCALGTGIQITQQQKSIGYKLRSLKPGSREKRDSEYTNYVIDDCASGAYK